MITNDSNITNSLKLSRFSLTIYETDSWVSSVIPLRFDDSEVIRL